MSGSNPCSSSVHDHSTLIGIVHLAYMFPAYMHHVSSGYTNFDESDDHWTTSPWRHLSMLLWQLELTTATWYSPAHRGMWPINYNGCWTPLHVSSAARASSLRLWTVTDSTWWLALTRCGRPAGSGTSLVSQSTDVSTTKHCSIW